MRAPETFNYKFDPPLPTAILNDKYRQYDWEEFSEFITGDTPPQVERSQEAEAICSAAIPKGLDGDTQGDAQTGPLSQELKRRRKRVSTTEGGCAPDQVTYVLENAAALPEPLPFAGLVYR